MLKSFLAPLKNRIKSKILDWVFQSDEYKKLAKQVHTNHVAISQQSDYIKHFMGGVSLPSEKLQTRVVGDYFDDYVSSGFRAFNDISRELERFKPEYLNSKINFLDFGCGPGRVSLATNKIMPDWNIYGCDIDQEAIAFGQKEYSSLGIRFDIVDPIGKSNYPDAFFNLVLGSSVFTHLPEDMQFAWLQELNRITPSGAILLLSVENKKSLSILNDSQLQTIKDKGFYFLEGWLTEGLPNWYRTTIHSKEYVFREWNKYFEILDIVELGIMSHQDCVVCRKR